MIVFVVLRLIDCCKTDLLRGTCTDHRDARLLLWYHHRPHGLFVPIGPQEEATTRHYNIFFVIFSCCSIFQPHNTLYFVFCVSSVLLGSWQRLQRNLGNERTNTDYVASEIMSFC
uniref:Putative secreted protein n=1 Tax=Anopheles marajoara TaxID=58244 RepID=A0A2M4C7M1_9DIPT